MSDPIIEVEQGKLKGKLCKSKTWNSREFFTFKGIPFAKPPVGELRFRAPEPPEPWDGIRDATEDCNVSAQCHLESDYYAGDEDCLYLNVYIPATIGSTLLPVMFYIHGGGFLFGYGTDDSLNGPDFFMKKDVVLVSTNYRLGILGFLSLDCKEAPGNMGLRDQVQALKWVQKNIKKFGGNPKNVTIFGLCAGAASVEYLVLSPMAKGLFHKAIAQGGSTLSHWAQSSKIKELASRIPIMKKKAVSDEKELLEYLKGLSTYDLLVTSMEVLAADKFKGALNSGYVPTIEKPGDWTPFLDKSTYDLLLRGEFTKVPFMTGFCTRAGLIMISEGASIFEKLTNETNFVEHLPFELNDKDKKELEVKFNTVYLGGDSVYKYIDNDYYAIDFFTDVITLGPSYTAASLMAKGKSRVFFYEFSYDGSLNSMKKMLKIKRKGACYTDDGGYMLKNVMLRRALDKDKLVSDRIVEMWTNFATYGNPTPKTNDLITTKWEPMDKNKSACLVIDDTLIMKNDVYPDRMRLFEELYMDMHLNKVIRDTMTQSTKRTYWNPLSFLFV